MPAISRGVEAAVAAETRYRFENRIAPRRVCQRVSGGAESRLHRRVSDAASGSAASLPTASTYRARLSPCKPLANTTKAMVLNLGIWKNWKFGPFPLVAARPRRVFAFNHALVPRLGCLAALRKTPAIFPIALNLFAVRAFHCP